MQKKEKMLKNAKLIKVIVSRYQHVYCTISIPPLFAYSTRTVSIIKYIFSNKSVNKSNMQKKWKKVVL